jgi:hydrogenase maturation protein HypF
MTKNCQRRLSERRAGGGCWLWQMKTSVLMPPVEAVRLKLAVRGAVQGVGFRPFVYRLATQLGLSGWINNSAQGAFIEVEGSLAKLENFLVCLEAEKPPRCFIQSLETLWLDCSGYEGFEIRPSEKNGGKTAIVLPDVATCPDCLREIRDPGNRRYRYPFTNCTNCGPRFSIIESIPYDRANTSMSSFAMCPRCRAEYEDPMDRRFHAQPNACPDCGPHLELWDREGNALFGGDEALRAAANAIRRGKIVAIKGVGGFQLMAAAHNKSSVQRLRQRKRREEKPFALMFPFLERVKDACEISPLEERLLRSPEAPIVLLHRSLECKCVLADSIAPGNPYLGVMLPYTPLHHLLMADLGFPVVASSGNLKDEPICISETEALQRLGAIADLFLVHNRPIVRHVDDSIVRVMMNREMVLRRARGFAPLPINLKLEIRNPKPEIVLAVGAHLKNTVALSVGPQVFLSQHIGDLETEQAFCAFRNIISDFQKLYEASPKTIVADMHPDYLSTRFAQEKTKTGKPCGTVVQHHVAHVLSCMAENELAAPALGIAWDGTGWGPTGSIWGGEFFEVTETSIDRIAHFRSFCLPGGDKAAREPRRVAAALLYEMSNWPGLEELWPTIAFSPREIAAIRTMLEHRLNSPRCSSVGRLFDAVAALIGLRQVNEFEGQAAMDLEFAMEGVKTNEAYPLRCAESEEPSNSEALLLPGSSGRKAKPLIALDWFPMIEAILSDRRSHVPTGEISARFHNTLAESVVMIAKKSGHPHVVLSGGCFQNRYLTERTIVRLREAGFNPYWHQRVPPNDGGIALGQIAASRRTTR